MSGQTWRGRHVAILGATSAIAEETARLLAADGANLALVARSSERLAAIAADLRIRGAGAVVTRLCDLVETPPSEAFFNDLAGELGGLDVVLIAHGVLGDQSAAEHAPDEAVRLIDANFVSAAGWALAAAQVLERTSGSQGVVAAIGSVAGDRGRASNFVYGAAKGGLGILMQGMAHKAALRGGPRAVIFKLGFVDTPMTASLPKGGPLWATPDAVARVIVKGLSGDSAIVYGPWFWRYILLVIRFLPERVFSRINL